MQLSDYLRIFVRRAWIIVLAMVVTATGAFAVSKIQTPVYRSTIYLNVIPARPDWGMQQTVKGYMRNFGRTIQSRQMATKVINRLQLDVTPEELLEKLTVTERICSSASAPVTITRSSPRRGATTAEALSRTGPDARRTAGSRRREHPGSPCPAACARWKINAWPGAVGILVEHWSSHLGSIRIIRTSADMERHSGVAVLGVIPHTAALARPSRERRRRERPSPV